MLSVPAPTPYIGGAEPSWTWGTIGEAMADHLLRPRRRMQLHPQEALTLHRQLLVLGRAANEVGHHLMAQAYFESAFNAKEDVAALVSAVNMRLKLGQLALAAAAYRKLLLEPPRYELPSGVRETVVRKLAEAREGIARRARAPAPVRHLEDEVAQLLRHRGGLAPTMAASADDEALFLRLLRKQGHAANEANDAGAAQLWFDCAYAASRSPRDLLSAANMRTKLVPGSPAAEALYLHLLALPAGAVGDDELRIAHRKLDALREQRDAAAAWQPAFDVEHVNDDDDEEEEEEDEEEAARSAWLAATVRRAHEQCADLAAGMGGEGEEGEEGEYEAGGGGDQDDDDDVVLMADRDRVAAAAAHTSLSHGAPPPRDWWAADADDHENYSRLENVGPSHGPSR